MACKRSVLVLVTVLLATGCVTLAKNKKAGGPPAKYAVQVQVKLTKTMALETFQ